MNVDLKAVRIAATKPNRKPAQLLAEMGVTVVGVDEDQAEGNVDRYVLSKRLAVERRTGSSFLRGIMDKTLFTSAITLREHYAVAILIVEGTVNYNYTGFDPRAVRGALSSMIVQYGLSVLSTTDPDDTARLLAMLARQEQLGIPDISLIPKRKATDLPDVQRRVVEMLPGCGMVLAREMLQHFGGVRQIMTADRDDLLALRGVGAKKADDILHVLTAEYRSVDTERDLEDAIEACPDLLFDRPMDLVARQLYMFTRDGKRQFVDLVFTDPDSAELVLVELKRGRLIADHYRQLRAYLDSAQRARSLRKLLAAASALRGVLATVAEGPHHRPNDPQVTVRVVDREAAIDVLCRRRKHLSPNAPSA